MTQCYKSHVRSTRGRNSYERLYIIIIIIIMYLVYTNLKTSYYIGRELRNLGTLTIFTLNKK